MKFLAFLRQDQEIVPTSLPFQKYLIVAFVETMVKREVGEQSMKRSHLNSPAGTFLRVRQMPSVLCSNAPREGSSS